MSFKPRKAMRKRRQKRSVTRRRVRRTSEGGDFNVLNGVSCLGSLLQESMVLLFSFRLDFLPTQY